MPAHFTFGAKYLQTNELLDTLEDLLQFGFHEGECDNLDKDTQSCKQHVKAFNNRVRHAKEVIARYRTNEKETEPCQDL